MEITWLVSVVQGLVVISTFLSAVLGEGERSTEARPIPRFVDTPRNFTYEEGELARLECSIQDLGTKKVIWRRSSDPNPLTIGRRTFVDDTRVQVEHMPLTTDWHLLIKQVRMDDEGQYECQVASRDKELRRYVTLIVKPGDVKVKPEIHIEGTTYVEKNGLIRLVCNATGRDHPPDDIDWFLNGQKLATDTPSGVTIQKRVSLTEKTIYSILQIDSASMKDAGIYVCRTSDLQIDSERVDVLNADTNNVKRDGVDYFDKGRKGHYNSHVTPGSGSNSSSPNSYFLTSLLALFVVCVQPVNLFHRTWLLVT